jgi:hypothetical protein
LFGSFGGGLLEKELNFLTLTLLKLLLELFLILYIFLFLAKLSLFVEV